jgi:hypothetical protein
MTMTNDDKIKFDNLVPADAGARPQRSTRPASRPKTDADDAAEYRSERDAAAVAVSMPSDREGLLAVAWECVELYNNAVLDRADFAALVIGERYEAAIWKLNGGTLAGSCAGDDSAGTIVRRYCAAKPGAVPVWGQQGEFLINVRDIRCWVKYGGGLGSIPNSHFEFNAVDLDAPFISETGYRSHFSRVVRGHTVDSAAIAIFSEFLGKHRRYLEAGYQDQLVDDQLPDWLQSLQIPARRLASIKEPADAVVVVPDGFVLVDVVLTARQAFIARKWAQSARHRIKKALR